MADSLGAVLAGINNGVTNGLDIYKTLRDDERFKREERRQSMRDTVDDQRWALGQARTVRLDERDLANDKALQEDRATGRDLQERTLKFNQEEALRDNAADERRHQQNLLLGQAKIDAANAKGARISTKAALTHLQGVYVGENGKQNFVEQVNATPEMMLSAAHQLGYKGATAEQMDGLRLLPVNGGYVLGRPGADGKMEMWDADNDPSTPDVPKQGHFFPERLVAGMFGGAKGIESADTAGLGGALADRVERGAEGVEAEAQKLKTTAEQQGAQVESARVALADAQNAPPGKHAALADSLGGLNAKIGEYTSRREAPPALLLSQRDAVATAQKAADAEYDAANVAPLRQSLGDEVQRGWDGTRGNQGQGKGFYAARDKVTGAPSALEAEQAARAKAIATSEASLGNIVNERGITEERAVQTQARADGVRAAWGTVQQGVSALPFAQQRDALRASEETFNVSPQLAARHPGKNLAEATELQKKQDNAFIDRILGAVDTKTQVGPKGLPQDLQGGKAELRAVMLAMSGERRIAIMDHTGVGEGAMQKAAQGALKIGKPEAMPYLLYADASGIDSAGAVALMQDKALQQFGNQGERFEKAAAAMDLVKAGKASTPEAALGMVLQGR